MTMMLGPVRSPGHKPKQDQADGQVTAEPPQPAAEQPPEEATSEPTKASE
jgi:hypothetical protein